jgi:hypothetical protein
LCGRGYPGGGVEGKRWIALVRGEAKQKRASMLKVRRRLMSSCLKQETGINNLPPSCRRPDRLLGVPVKAGLSQKFRSSLEPTMLLWRLAAQRGSRRHLCGIL